MLQHILQMADPWLEHYGYAAVFGIMFLEGIGVPAPGLTVLLAATLLASQGDLHLGIVVATALGGYVGASQLAFFLGRTGGRRSLLRLGVLNRHRLRALQRLFERWGALLLVAAPFVDGTRQYSALSAGAAEMRWRRFAGFNLVGSAAWVGTWSAATDVLGHHIERVLAFLQAGAPWLIGALLSVVAGFLAWRVLHRPARERGKPGPARR